MDNNTVISWPGWETVGLIGRGSFGAVYKIQRDVLGEMEEAALKVISMPQNNSDLEDMYNDGYDEESVTETFRAHLKSIVAEYSMMRKLGDCVNIVNCDDIRYVQHDDGVGWDIFIKMELLTPLPKALPAQIAEETVVQLAKDMCAALTACEAHSLVHRDIKPQNMFVSSAGAYKLGDFGIAKTVEKTMGGTMIGTYQYMAPEVYNHQPYSSSPDIYSLGLVLYWMLNERRGPFLPLPPEKIKAGMEEQARLRRFSGEELPPPAHGSEKLKRIVLKACAFDPKARYASAAEFLEALDAEEMPPVIPASPIPDPILDSEPASNPVRPSSAKKLPTALLCAIAAVLLLAVGFFTIHFWTVGSCTESSVCKLCGKVRLAAPGHQWDSATCTESKTCRVCGETTGSALGHNWQKATCTEAKTCKTCGETEGEALGHRWLEATCTDPETCEQCGEQKGRALGHNWIHATFTTPQTCQTCGATTGTAIDYKKISVEDEVLAIREKYKIIVANRDSGKYQKINLFKGVDAYYGDNHELMCVIVYRGTEGIGKYSDTYSRFYYFDNGSLIFAFYEGSDAHRLYFFNELLMRWRCTAAGSSAVNYDFLFSEDFYFWEKIATNEVLTFE